MRITNSRKNIVRMNEIARVLIKYGFSTVASKLGVSVKLLHRNEDIYDDINDDTNVRIRMVLQELGTSFIKLGQTLSTYPNLIGYELAEELSKLQEAAPIDDFETVKNTIESEFQKPLDEIFDEFSTKPIASASIGQVHTAFLNNKHVAIKIQHEGVDETVQSDIRLMHILAKRLNDNISALHSYNLPGIIDVFEQDMKKELDYKFEAMNAVHLGHILEDDEVYIPEVYLEYTTNKVLTMEYLEGVSLNKVMESSDDEYDKQKIALQGADSFIKQILIYGFFHADPHAGNIFVLEDNRVAFVDFGMMGHLDDKLREDISQLFVFVSESNARLITKQLFYMGIINDDKHLDDIEYEIINILDKNYGVQFDDITAVIRDIIEDDILNKYGIVIPRDVMMVIRAISMIDDIGKVLYPDFNTTEIVKPYALQMLSDNVKPERMLAKTTEKYIDLKYATKNLSTSLNNVFDIFEDGRVNISLDLYDFEKVDLMLSKTVNIIVLAIIIAAMLLASSLIMLIETDVTILGYPLLGFIGYVFSAILGIILIIMIIRRGNY